MTLPVLREDALTTRSGGFVLRLSLPWIRSLPIASLGNVAVQIDDAPVAPLVVELGNRLVPADALEREHGWWFVQDRVVLRGQGVVTPGSHDVTVSFALVIPYLQAGPDGPLTLPFAATRTLLTDAAAAPASVSRDVA
jgi:hypothetical protein